MRNPRIKSSFLEVKVWACAVSPSRTAAQRCAMHRKNRPSKKTAKAATGKMGVSAKTAKSQQPQPLPWPDCG